MLFLLAFLLTASASAQKWVFDPPYCFGVGKVNRITFQFPNNTVSGDIGYFSLDWGPYNQTSSMPFYGAGKGSTSTFSYTYEKAGTYTPSFVFSLNDTEWKADVGSAWIVDKGSCVVQDPPTLKRDHGLEWVADVCHFGYNTKQSDTNRLALVISVQGEY